MDEYQELKKMRSLERALYQQRRDEERSQPRLPTQKYLERQKPASISVPPRMKRKTKKRIGGSRDP